MNEQKFHVGVKALVLNENNEILLLRANPEEMSNKLEHWDLPGGRIEGNDSIEATLVKEVEEELGTRDIEIIEHFDTFISNFKIPVEDGSVSLMLIVYKCKLSDNNMKFKLSSENLEYKWVTIQEAKELLRVKYPESFIQKLDSLRN
jgi:8-oxo-dGTP diphosphatase